MENQGAKLSQGQRKANADLHLQDQHARSLIEKELARKDKRIRELESQLESGKGSSKTFAVNLDEKNSKITELEEQLSK
jgi:peptidoglycan hydrolase CwlO-like protein